MPVDSEAPAETQKRAKIADEFAAPLKGLAKGIMLGGSMGYGQNYSVNPGSDIDCVIVIDPSALPKMAQLTFFSSIPASAQKLFAEGNLSFIHISDLIDGVPMNTFVYNAEQYVDFCLAQEGLTGFALRHPTRTQKAWKFDGTQIMFDRDVRPVQGGFLYDKPALFEGKYFGAVPRQDFFNSGQVLHQQNGFFRELEPRVWRKTIELLVAEHGPNPNLSRTNILNTHFTYQKEPDRLPNSVITRINERTFAEIE